MYQPITTKSGANMIGATTMMSPKGMDQRNLPQLLNVDYAQNIQNYIITGTGQLEKRKGIATLFTSIGNDAITMCEKFSDTYYIFAYGTTVAGYDTTTGLVTTIKSDFTGTSFEGVKYGDYFFVTNKTDGLWRISNTLTITDLSAVAPLANVIAIFGARMLLGDLSTDETAVTYSAPDDGTDPPFSIGANWTEGTLMTDAGSVYYRNGGKITSIASLGQSLVVFAEDGKWAFQIVPENVGGVYYKDDSAIMYRQDMGGERGAITTPVGLIYANEKGFWQLTSVGQDNIPFSDQETLTPVLLGDDYFNDIDASNGSLIYDAKRGYIYFACAQNSSTNNLVIAMNMNTSEKPISRFTGLNVSRFFEDSHNIYAGSAVKSVLYKMFTGYDDEGLDIGTDYYQELNMGSLETRKTLLGCYVQGFLSQSSTIKVKYDIYDTTGRPITDKVKFSWTSQYNLNGSDGWGTAKWGGSAWGGDLDYGNLIESFDGCRPTIRNYMRVSIHITCSDTSPHIINWLSLQAKEKVAIRRRKMTKIS